MAEFIQSQVFTLITTIKNFFADAGFPVTGDFGLQEKIKNEFTFDQGAQTYFKPSVSQVNLIEPIFQHGKQSPIQMSPIVLPDTEPGELYQQRIKADYGTPPYTFESLITDKKTVTRVGIEATDQATTAVQYFTVPIQADPAPLQIVTEELPWGRELVFYDEFIGPSGGTREYSWLLGIAPPWLTITESGRLQGNPPINSNGLTYVITVILSDGVDTVEKTFNLVISGSNERFEFISPTTLPPAQVNTEYRQLIQVRGISSSSLIMRMLTDHPWLTLQEEELDFEMGSPKKAYVLSGFPTGDLLTRSNLPAGLNLLEDGFLYGSLGDEGTQNFQIRVTDSRGFYQEQFYSLLATLDAGKSITFETGKILEEAYIGQEYSNQLEAIGGIGPYTFSLFENNTLPPGLTISASGTIYGIPELYSIPSNVHQPYYTFIITITDSQRNSRSKQFILKINNERPVTISNTTSKIEEINILSNPIELKYPNRENRRSAYATLTSATTIFDIDLQAVSGGGIAEFTLNLGNSYIVNDEILGSKPAKEALTEAVSFTSVTELTNNIGLTLKYFLDLLEYQKTQFIYENGNWKEA